MKKLFLLSAVLFFCPPAFSSPAPFRYTTPCFLETSTGEVLEDQCVVIETRNKGGFLNSRNIFSNKFQLSVKGRFKEDQGYVTWDSHNKFEYKWEYKVGRVPGSTQLHTYVMPGFLLRDVSWD